MNLITPIREYCRKGLNRFQRIYLRANARFSLEHISGPTKLNLRSNDVIVVCLMRNGSPYIATFLCHYRKIGAAHFVFIDNGSTDDSVEKATAADTTVVRSNLPFDPYQIHLRSAVAKRFAMGSWCICADIDELFDFRHSNRLGLRGLARYLDEHGYTCAVGQMLDMFPGSETALSNSIAGDYESYCTFYDLSCIERHDYKDFRWEGFDYFTRHNTVASPKIQWLFGGVRRRLFDANVCLTKHPITRISADSDPCSHPHCASNVRCADISVLIRHYKFVGDFRRRMETEAQTKAFTAGDRERYVQGLQKTPRLQFLAPSARRYSGTDDLLREEFLVTSTVFEEWVLNCADGQIRANANQTVGW